MSNNRAAAYISVSPRPDQEPPRLIGVLESGATLAAWFFVVASWFGETLAELGRFSGAGMLLGTGFTMAVGALAVRRVAAGRWRCFVDSESQLPRPSGDRRPSHDISVVEAALLAAILIAAASLYLRPSEAVFATHDAGARINAAAHIAQTGRIQIDDPNLWIAMSVGDLTTSLGLYAVDPPRGLLLPQFSGVTEIWEALLLTTLNLPGGLLDGYQAAPSVFPQRPFYLPAIFALLALLIGYCALRRIIGISASLAASAALALSYPEIIYARLVMAEVPTQLCLAIACFGLVRFWQDCRDRDAALAGAATGLALLTHIDAIFLYLPISLWLLRLLAGRQLKRGHLAFFGFAGLLLLQGLGHYLVFECPYLRSNLDVLRHLPDLVIIAVPVGVVMLALSWTWFENKAISSGLVTIRRSRLVAAGFVVAVAIFAYAVRPIVDPVSLIVTQAPDQEIDRISGISLQLLGQYLSPLTLFLSLIGVTTVIVRGAPRGAEALLCTGGLYAVIFGWSPLVSPIQPFWVRRFVPEVIPFLLFSATLGCLAIGRAVAGTKYPLRQQLLTTSLLAALVTSTALVGAPLWRIGPEFQGGIAETNSFSQALPEHSIVVFDDSAAARWLPLPLTFLFGRDSFVSPDGEIDPSRLGEAIARWHQEGRQVVLVTSGEQLTLDPKQWGLRPITQQRFRFPAFPIEHFRPPTGYTWIDFSIAAYEVIPIGQLSPSTVPFERRLGKADYPNLLSDLLIRRLPRAQIQGPTAEAPPVGIHVTTIDGVSHEAILAHPDSQISFPNVHVPAHAELVVSTGIDPGCAEVSAGAHFAVEVTSGRITRRIFARTMQPVPNLRDRQWIDERIDLSPWADQNVTLTFLTEVVNRNYRCAWALWGDPAIEVSNHNG